MTDDTDRTRRAVPQANQHACAFPDCEESAVTFRHFPTVAGYCLRHGNVLADFLSLIDCGGDVGFDGARARWERIRERRYGVDA